MTDYQTDYQTYLRDLDEGEKRTAPVTAREVLDILSKRIELESATIRELREQVDKLLAGCKAAAERIIGVNDPWFPDDAWNILNEIIDELQAAIASVEHTDD